MATFLPRQLSRSTATLLQNPSFRIAIRFPLNLQMLLSYRKDPTASASYAFNEVSLQNNFNTSIFMVFSTPA